MNNTNKTKEEKTKLTFTWDGMYELAKHYYNYHGHLFIPFTFKTKDGINYNAYGYPLGTWINTQRISYKNRFISKEDRTNKRVPLSDDKIKRLLEIGMIFENVEEAIREYKWNHMYKLAEIFYKNKGHLLVLERFKTKNGIDHDEDGEPLGKWIEIQRIAYSYRFIKREQRKKKILPLTDEQVEKLLEIGMVFNNVKEIIYQLNWDKMYELAKSYYNYHGHLFVPDNFKTTNGYDYDKDGKGLDTWINVQRTAYKNRNIPKEKRTNSGLPLTDERLNKLLEIGMIFGNVEQIRDEYNWNQMYELAESYYNHYSNLFVSEDFKTTNGYDYDKDGYSLGRWIKTQRVSYKNRNIPKEKRTNTNLSLTDKRMNKLLEIGMVFENVEQVRDNNNWNQMYKLAESYYNYHKNLFIPQDFKTKNGYFYDSDGYSLGTWLNTQRISYKNRNISKEKRTNSGLPLTDDKLNKLLEIGMVFENVEQARDEYNWNQIYELARSYYNYHGNLIVTYNFETVNGYEYEEDGFRLGVWISNQRKAYKNRTITKEERKNSYSPLTDERLAKLLAIDMVFSPKENKQDCIKLCEEYRLDVKKYPYLKDNISYRELNAKINFLLDKEEPITINNEIHEIFQMSNKLMQEKYNITKYELIEQYYKESMNRGR